MTQLLATFRENDEEQAELNTKLNQEEEVKEPNYEQIIDDEFAFPRFSEDPEEQNKLNIRHALKKSTSGMNLTEVEKTLLMDNGYDDFVVGGKTGAPAIDAAVLASPFLLKAAPIALPFAGGLIKKYPLKALEVGLTALGAADYQDNPQDLVLETLGMKTDTMFSGGKMPSPFNPVATKKLIEIFSGIFDGPNPKFATEGANIPNVQNTFFMSKSDDVTGGLRDFSKVTSPEYENIIISGMERMGMKNGIFDIDLYDQNSNILAEMSDTLGGSVMKSGMRRTKKLGKRNWMEYFLSPESLKGNFEALRKEGKVAADLEWEDFLKTKGLTVQDIQVHHINPLYDSIHLFDGVKWGSDEYWEIISELIGSGARPGIVQRGDDVTNVIRTLGKSSLTDTPHGIAHAYYKDIVPTFFSKSERLLMKTQPGYRLQKTKEWSKIVNQSEDIVVKAHKAWTALNPKSRMPFEELVEEMAAYDNMGVLKGVSIKYQVKDIKEMVTQIQFEDIIEDKSVIGMMSEVEFEFMNDVVKGLTKKELYRKWGKKYNLKAIGAKQLDLFTK
jgi:hypothetical protein